MPFPTHLGHGCDSAFSTVELWSIQSSAYTTSLRIGYFSWFFLLGGLVGWLRASGRGRCGWEPTSAVLCACLPPVWFCIQNTFHPEDLAAMGAALGSAACAWRGRWIAAGALIGLAFLFQQFAVLIAGPLLMVAPSHKRVGYGAGGAGVVVGATVPLVSLVSGNLLHVVLIGTGYAKTDGGTWVYALNLNGAPLAIVSRLLPIALSLLISYFVVHRLKARGEALDPVVFTSLLTVSLGLRLVFEFNLYAYYFMPLTVSLLLLEVARGHIRSASIVWWSGVSLLNLPMSFLTFVGFWDPADVLPLLLIAAALGLLTVALVRAQMTRIAAVVAVGLLAIEVSRIGGLTLRGPVPTWVWQVLFVAWAMALAVGPLLQPIRRDDVSTGWNFGRVFR